jgi:hypothetical protein
MRREAKDYKTLGEDACEIHVCKFMESKPGSIKLNAMSDIVQLISQLYYIDTLSDDEQLRMMPEDITDSFLYKLIDKRVEHLYQYGLSYPSIVMIMSLAESPGAAVLYLTYIQYVVAKVNPKLKNQIIKMDDLMEIFTKTGLWSNDDLEEVWDNQKLVNHPSMSMDNIVDHMELCKSIFD